MNKLLATIGFFLVSFTGNSQNVPFGFSSTLSSVHNLPVTELATFDHQKLLAEDTQREKQGGRSNIGRIIPSSTDENEVGNWTTLPNGDRLWQWRFKTANAKGVSVYFNDLFLPLGSSLVLYPVDKSYFLGPFSNKHCNSHGRFMIGEVVGDEAILEYYEPAAVVGNAHLGISGISHLYRYVQQILNEDSDERGSDECEVDVNCPEGSQWTNERDGVVRLTISSGNSVGLCSGSLVNTLAKDCRKYILTAMHCGEEVSASDWLTCSATFKYQRSACTSGSAPSFYNMVGMFHLADSNDGGGQTGSDFLLLELEDPIPVDFNAFFCGWSAETTTPVSGVSIHHPAGDRKKISTTEDIISGTYNAIGFHWRVKWMLTETNWGVTEGGSSGSPLFNQDHQLVGTLTGGLSFCTNQTGPDYYGKMSKHWTSNPNSADQKLKVWLDPNNTGILSMNGTYIHAGAALPCDPGIVGINEAIQFDDIMIYPSLADQQLTLSSSRYSDVDFVKVFDNAGKIVTTAQMNNSVQTLNTQQLPAGIYYITFVTKNGSFITKKFAVSH